LNQALQARGLAFAEQKRAAKGTIRFTPDKPIPPALVRKLIKTRVAQIEAGAKPGAE
jgi:hypothetical protein